jgi:hypothetical protein
MYTVPAKAVKRSARATPRRGSELYNDASAINRAGILLKTSPQSVRHNP